MSIVLSEEHFESLKMMAKASILLCNSFNESKIVVYHSVTQQHELSQFKL